MVNTDPTPQHPVSKTHITDVSSGCSRDSYTSTCIQSDSWKG